MLVRIRLAGVASYKLPAVLETDKRVNVVYGLNGSGKSTISNYLYQLDGSDYSGCEINPVEGISLHVYNQKFIDENFFEADSFKGIFSLSKENKDVEQRVEVAKTRLGHQHEIVDVENKNLDRIERDIASQKALAYDATWDIKKRFATDDRTLERFLDGLKANKETLFQYLIRVSKPTEKPDQSIEQLKKSVELIGGQAARQYNPLSMLEFSGHDIESDPIFKKTIVGSDDSSVSGVIGSLRNSDWVQSGMGYVDLSQGEPVACPFCQHNTITQELVSQIEKYFDVSYGADISHVNSLEARYKASLGELPSIEDCRQSPFALGDMPDVEDKYRSIISKVEENIRRIEDKRSFPSSVVSLECTRTEFDAINKSIEAINFRVVEHNKIIENADTELIALKQKFWELMRWEYDQPISDLAFYTSQSESEISAAQYRKAVASKEIETSKSEISSLLKLTVNTDEAVDRINEGLSSIGISDFSIAKHSDVLYNLVRAGASAAEFFTLSEGEKMIISFLYFCERCKERPQEADVGKKRVIVIDDPVSSLSNVFVFNIGRLIKSEFFDPKKCDQVFVLTHSLYFLYELADSRHEIRKRDQKLFRLFKNSEGSQLVSMKYEEVQNDYHSYWSIATDPKQPPALVANCMRNIIEYFFNFVEKRDLGNIFQRPELQGNNHQAFCRYMNRESHSLGQNIFDFSEFDYEYFRSGLRLVFEAMGYPEHYNEMARVLTNRND